MNNTKTPHIHAEVIKAWADGAKVQGRYSRGKWQDITKPSWQLTAEYRVKPENIVRYGYVSFTPFAMSPFACRVTTDNVKMVFTPDGQLFSICKI